MISALRRLGRLLLLTSLAGTLWGDSLNVLFFSKSSGWEHSVIKRPEGGGLSHAEKILSDLGDQHDLTFTFSKDGSKFSAAYLAGFDVVFFYASGNLERRSTDGNPPMTAAGKAALLEWVAQGGSFAAVHAGSDCFHTYEAFDHNPPKAERGHRYHRHGEAADPYIKMLGGEFISHGVQQVATARVVTPEFPGMAALGDEVYILEEWYSLKEFAADLHVLLVMETAGMEGSDYARPNYPLAWARSYGQGRVWYNALGHREDVWESDYFHQMLVGGIAWVAGRRDADIPGNLLTVTPQAHSFPPR